MGNYEDVIMDYEATHAAKLDHITISEEETKVLKSLGEALNDDGSVRRMVEVSTWGEKAYVDYDEYIALCGEDLANYPFSSVTNTTINN